MTSDLRLINRLLPFTREESRCAYKKQKKIYQREKLAQMIEAYRRGEPANFRELHLGMEAGEVVRMIESTV